MSKKEKNKKKNRTKKMKKCFNVLCIIIPIVCTLIGIWYTKKQNVREEQVLEPKFSLEKNIDTDGKLVWKVCNTDGEINNAIIYPTLYITFWISNDELELDTEITVEILDHYSGKNYYNNQDKTFYVEDKKQLQLNEFIKKCLDLFDSKDGWVINYDESVYFTLNYSDYKKKRYNKIYTINDYSFHEDNSKREIFGEQFLQLETVSKIPKSDIIAPSKFEKDCVIIVNYKKASTKELIQNEEDYEVYLYSVILNLINSKDKPVDEMLGELVLTEDGTAYIRNNQNKGK